MGSIRPICASPSEAGDFQHAPEYSGWRYGIRRDRSIYARVTSTNAPRADSFGPGRASCLFVVRKSVSTETSTIGLRPSLTEGFFLTVAHEMGHALGCSTPLLPALCPRKRPAASFRRYARLSGDIAGISNLYPRGNLAQSTRQYRRPNHMPRRQGIHMASVVAIRASGPAVSALTDPDGRYRIDGVPAGPVCGVRRIPCHPRGEPAQPWRHQAPVGADGVAT